MLSPAKINPRSFFIMTILSYLPLYLFFSPSVSSESGRFRLIAFILTGLGWALSSKRVFKYDATYDLPEEPDVNSEEDETVFRHLMLNILILCLAFSNITFILFNAVYVYSIVTYFIIMASAYAAAKHERLLDYYDSVEKTDVSTEGVESVVPVKESDELPKTIEEE